MRRLGLAERVFLSTAAIVIAVVGAALALASYAGRRAAAEAERRGLEQAADLTAQLLAGRGRSLAGGARVFVQGPYFRALVAERRRDDILDQAFEAADQLEADWVFITDERGALLAKSDEPGVAGDDLRRLPLVAGALGGQLMSGFGVSGDTLLFQTVAVPIVVPGAAPVGTLVATRIVDAQVARDVRAATASDVVFFTFDAQGRPRVSTATLPAPRAAAVLAPALRGGTIRDEDAAPPLVTVGSTSYVTQRAAVATAGGDVVGGFVVLRARDTTPPGMAGLLLSFGTAAVIGLLLALGVAWSAARRVARPARALAGATASALHGEYERAARELADVVPATRDELATLAATLGALIAELRDRRTLAAAVDPIGAPTATTDTGATMPSAPDSATGRAMTVERASPPRRGRRVVAGAVPREAPEVGRGPRPGELLAGRYVVETELGAGGNGTVYRVRDLVLGGRLALKRLRPELLAAEPLAAGRLAQALRLAQRIHHRNVVRIHDVGESAGAPYIAMELVEGSSLAALLQARGPLPEPVVVALAAQLARALEAAHAQGVVHGDLKPANLLVDRHGQLKVGDFGVAAVLRHAVARRADGGADAAGPRRQLMGALIGSPEYLAPELLLGEAPHVRGDLYAAGVVLHECLTGSTPFHGDSPGEFLARKLTPPRADDAPVAGRDATAPRSLAGIVACLTAADRDARPASAAALGALVAALG